MTFIITLVGDLGGGKTTLAKVLGMIAKDTHPESPTVANVTMGNGITKVDDVHKFIATKLIAKDRRYACVLDDEAAQAGLESRGSGSKAAALEARIITHARKANIDLILVSQLKSMLDKRAQWVEDVSVLCEAVFLEGNFTTLPNYFHYQVYDKWLDPLTSFDLDTLDMMAYVWPGMDTYDIPFFSSFKKQFESYYSITPEDHVDFERIMAQVPVP